MNIVTPNSAEAPQPPEIDCVIIGVNCEQTLARCLNSVQAADFPAAHRHIYYVDGGSTDKSVEIAHRFSDVTVISLTPEYPTPGLGRNRGWQSGTSPFVQFLDSDTILHSGWIKQGLAAMNDPAVGAVQGLRREMYPERSVFNWIGDLEWNGEAGETDCFGGDVMIRRQALETVGGYDEVLVGGEDPELSRRVIRGGWRILRLNLPMTRHDLAMTRLGQYIKRAYRSGYGFAAVREREARLKSLFWRHEMRKILVRGAGFILLGGFGLTLAVSPSPWLKILGYGCMVAATAGLLRPRLMLVKKFMALHRLSRPEARRYAWHCSLVVLPQLIGVARYYGGKWMNRPLRNRRNQLITRKTGN